MSRLADLTWRYGAALVATVATSLVIGAILAVAPIGNLPILYLIPVLVAATRLGRGPAIVASIAAFLLYDWFFIEPLHEITIADPAEWLALLLFLVTAVITSQLAANERARAEVAIRREREASLLYEALRLMGEPDLDAALRAVAERVRAELSVATVAVELTVAGRKHEVAVGDTTAIALATDVLSSGSGNSDHGKPGRWIRVVPPSGAVTSMHIRRDTRRYEVPIRSNDQTIGSIALIRDAKHTAFATNESRLLALLATQLGALAARAELNEATTQGEILRRTDELKSALLAAVSHDLRTPLASIIASAGSLRQPDVQWTDAEKRSFVSDIENEARRLARIVDNLLDLSRMESGALRPEKAWYDIGSLVDEVLGRLRAVTVGRKVSVDIPDELPPVHLDYVEIDQVLSNLVENAVRHTPAGTAIAISARQDRDNVVIEVADSGPGIDTRALPHLFEAFYRGAPRTRVGIGLGLAVARGLVEAHGGTITAENRPAGGAVFRFTLPIDATTRVPATT
ncbi:MAG TPA: ATP-binding protein [Candidatus Acidoferrales bacterium]|nr:ATP-binding protein [Candidatus Acidoferrales bacterium]